MASDHPCLPNEQSEHRGKRKARPEELGRWTVPDLRPDGERSSTLFDELERLGPPALN